MVGPLLRATWFGAEGLAAALAEERMLLTAIEVDTIDPMFDKLCSISELHPIVRSKLHDEAPPNLALAPARSSVHAARLWGVVQLHYRSCSANLVHVEGAALERVGRKVGVASNRRARELLGSAGGSDVSV